jgi:ABC-type multidrug transport system ATPase subunit
LFSKAIYISISCWKSSSKTREEKPGFEITATLDNITININQLSGGEKSRLSIALSCALCEIEGSKILLLDESLAGLDSSNIDVALDVLKEWAIRNKVLIILVSHNSPIQFFDKIIKL